MSREKIDIFHWRFGIGHSLMASVDHIFLENAGNMLRLASNFKITQLSRDQQGYVAGVYTGLVETMPLEQIDIYKEQIKAIVGENNFMWLEKHARVKPNRKNRRAFIVSGLLN